MTTILRTYHRILQKYPTTFQSIQTGILLGTGDCLAQKYFQRDSAKETYNYKRTAQFIGLGTFFVAPTLSNWYRFLSKYLGEGGRSVVLKKVALDQLCFAPSFMVAFLSTLNFIQGKSFDETKQLIKRDYFDILITNYKVWPAFQLVNFYFIPLNYQVITVQIMALFWNTYLSWKTQTPNKS